MHEQDSNGERGFHQDRQDNKQVILAWFSTILTMIGFVWQAAVLWTTNEATARQVEVLVRRSEEDTKRITRIESALEILVKSKE